MYISEISVSLNIALLRRHILIYFGSASHINSPAILLLVFAFYGLDTYV